MDGGTSVLFFTLQDPFEESGNAIQARAILNHFRQYTAEVGLPREHLVRRV